MGFAIPSALSCQGYRLSAFGCTDRSDQAARGPVSAVARCFNATEAQRSASSARSAEVALIALLIAMSRCRVLGIDGNVIEIDGIDAFADTPVLDIKP